jgi:predicted RNA-binding protein with PIN domain
MSPLFIIDGFNVLHAGVLTGRDRANWWQAAMQRRLIARLEQGTYPSETVLWVVFDRRSDRYEENNVTSDNPQLQIFYAPSADDWIVAQVQEHGRKYAITVVTADRPLQERVRRAGGLLTSPLQFLATCA